MPLPSQPEGKLKTTARGSVGQSRPARRNQFCTYLVEGSWTRQ